MGWEDLTDSEQKVAALVREGLTNRQIGERLFVEPSTIHWHLKNIFRKLGISSRTELALVASGSLADASGGEST